MSDNLLTAFHAFVKHILMSFSEDEMLLLRHVKMSNSFKDLPFSVAMSPF